jgi:VIT1/CCC1 family predicted Fe2+/Mn2+ transporter
MSNKADIARYKTNWQAEIDSATVYRAMQKAEKQTQMAEIYGKLATVEESHLKFWEQKITEKGGSVPTRKPSGRARIMAWLALTFGPKLVLPTIATLEDVDKHGYDNQKETNNTKMGQQERSHARILGYLVGNSKQGLDGGSLAQLEGRHRAPGGNSLRAAVLGANDGLVSNLSLVMGVAGANLPGQTILVTGLAGLLAGACSMALGEWLSVQSSRELYQRQIAIEATEIEEVPEEEEEELALIYESKGLPQKEAQALASKLISDDTTALDTLAREELGIDPDELGGSAWVAAITSFFLFSMGAIVPVISFMFLSGLAAVGLSLALSALALFIIGAGITLMTGRSIWYSGMRQVIFGLLAAAVTFGVGKIIGVSTGG